MGMGLVALIPGVELGGRTMAYGGSSSLFSPGGRCSHRECAPPECEVEHQPRVI